MAQLELRRFDLNALANPQFKEFPGGWYYGEFVNGMRHGEGIFFWPYGEAYMGSWANDMRNGYGIFRNSNGSVRIGTWLNRRLIGHGVEFGWFAPSAITFPLPDDADFREAVGEEFIQNYRDWLVDSDYELGPVFEGVFRGDTPDGFGTYYRRDHQTGKVTDWTVGSHDDDYKLDGYGTSHDGQHPAFNTDKTELQEVYTVTGMFNHGERQPGPGRITTSYWLGETCIQAIEANGYINEHGYLEGWASLSLDGTTRWAGYVDPDMDEPEHRQIITFLEKTDIGSNEVHDFIVGQRDRTIERILEEGEDPTGLDSSSLVPTFADGHPLRNWVVDAMASMSAAKCESLAEKNAELERIWDGSLEYTRRCKIRDEDGDVVERTDAVRILKGRLTVDFEIPFKPTIVVQQASSEDGTESRKQVYIMFHDKIVGAFTYDDTKLTVKTDEMTYEYDDMYYGEGTRVFIPVTDGGADFEHILEVDTDYADSDEHPNDIITRDMQTWLDEDDDNDDLEGMDVERDEDGNITGIGSSDEKNIGTILNLFKQGAHFVSIDEIVEKAKRTK